MLARTTGSLVAAVSFLASAASAQCHDWVSTFAPPTGGKGLNARAYDMVRWNGGFGDRLYAGGDFNQAGATATNNHVGAWNGTSWATLGSGAGNGSVFALCGQETVTATLGAPALYAGGGFTSEDSSNMRYVARWNGASWAPLGTPTSNGTNGNVFSLCVYDSGSGPELYVAGQFTSVSDSFGTTAVNNIARWNGTKWLTCTDSGTLIDGTAGGSIPGRIDAMCVFDDGFGPKLYVGGWFNQAGGQAAELVATWDGTNWARLGATNTMLNGTNVYDMCVFDIDGCLPNASPALMLGGGFSTQTYMGGTPSLVNNVAMWNAALQGFQPLGGTANPGCNNVVRDLYTFDDGLGYGEVLFATGHFTTADGIPASLIARYEGNDWYPLGAGLGGGGVSLCMADYDDGSGTGPDLYVGSICTTAGPYNSNYIAEWRGCRGAPYPVQNGEIAMTSFSNDPCEYVLRVIDPRPPYPVPPNVAWNAPQFHNEFNPTASTEVWDSTNLGQLFGVCFDTQTPPNIYASAASIYTQPAGGPGGDGAIYKIDRFNGDISTWATLPNTGPALGDVCYDRFHNQFFASNFEDGKIYRLNASGGIIDSFDPFAADGGGAGFCPLGERVWAVQVFNNRDLYFSAWLRDDGFGRDCTAWPASWPPQGSNPVNNAIFRVTINGTTGAFVGNVVLVLVQPPWLVGFGQCDYSNPCADIAFSPDNKRMLLAERDMYMDNQTGAHQARVLEYVGGGPGNQYLNWVSSTSNWYIGEYNVNANAAGGADYECGFSVVASGDALHLTYDAIYGVQCIPAGGNTFGAGATSTSHLIDHDGNTMSGYKTWLGDVETYRPVCNWWWYDYCTAKVNSQGCSPAIAASGNTSIASSEPFTITCTNVINQKVGLLFYSLNGPASLPFQGGTMCMNTPISRTPLRNSGGNAGTNDCSGVFTIDMKAYSNGTGGGAPNPALSHAGTVVDCEWWSRDPGSPPSNTSLSNALEYVVQQ